MTTPVYPPQMPAGYGVNLPSGTAIPGATAALLSILTTAFAQDGTVLVQFGPLPEYVPAVTIQITEVTGNQNPAELGPNYRREESFSIVCSIVTYEGDQNFAAAMASAFSYFTQISPIIGNNPSLNNTVRYAQVGNFHGEPDVTPKAQCIYTLDFNIRCTQRVESLS
jgi:hypothetical protein